MQYLSNWGQNRKELPVLSLYPLSAIAQFLIFVFFFPPQCRHPPPPAEGPWRTRFGRSGRLFFLVWSPSHLHECLRLSVLHTPPLCPMFANGSLFYFCYPAPNGPSFRVSWSIASLFLYHQATRGLRCDPPILSPISFSPILALESVSFPSQSFLVSLFSLFLVPLFYCPLPYLALCTHFLPCFCV